jgi:trehalose-6-phosphate synthase
MEIAHYCCGHQTKLRIRWVQQLPPSFLVWAMPDLWGDCVLKEFEGRRQPFSECGNDDNRCKCNVVVWSQFDVETADAWFCRNILRSIAHDAIPTPLGS